MNDSSSKDPSADDPETRYRKRMQRKKTLVDDAIARAEEERGVVVLLTGNGKGKSSSAFGMAARCLGHGMEIGIVQFIKSRTDTGEQAFFEAQAGVEFCIMGTGFTWDTQDKTADIAAAKRTWQTARAMLANPQLGLVVLDELTYMLSYAYLDEAEVLEAIASRPRDQHVVITGRAAKDSLIDLSDTVSELADVKHAFRAGIKAMPGIEW